jgi:hypothetical protein
MIWYIYIYIYIFNCNWVDTRWQQYSSHLHTNSTQHTENEKYITITGIFYVGLINESRVEGYWLIGCPNLFSCKFRIPSLPLNIHDVKYEVSDLLRISSDKFESIRVCEKDYKEISNHFIKFLFQSLYYFSLPIK